ncbi:MAG: adenine deaminase C-terminal domain-containing protein [Alicyclobacillaceae bacterium]|nr:adenine deaminase C-terminal domain-containing protein [Alicyclobacillaceae bacterium]
MLPSTLFLLSAEKRKALIEVARGKRAATRYFMGGSVLNTYSGECHKANVAVYEDRIAYVGMSDAMVGEETEIVRVEGKVLCPGYIEPHSHPFLMYNPVAYAEQVMALGTTLLVNDNWPFALHDFAHIPDIFRWFRQLPVRMLWSIRLELEYVEENPDHREYVRRLIALPEAIQVGELTNWFALLDGNETMSDWVGTCLGLGKRVEVHAPGASGDTLSTLAAGGITACHESITAEEVVRRLRQGIYATIRHSTLRPDLPEIVRELLKHPVSTNRLMFTTDGPTPMMFKEGFTDYLVRLAIEAGMDPIRAYQTVTINPATYYRLDEHVGGIAPGRLADILVLADLTVPTPERVYIGGELVAENGRALHPFPRFPWERYEVGRPLSPPFRGKTPPEIFDMKAQKLPDPYPVMNLVNAAIIRLQEVPLASVVNGLPDDFLYVSVLSRDGRWVSNGVIRGFASHLDGMASSYNFTGDIVVFGKDREAMARAVDRVGQLGGGIVVVEGGEVLFELPLELGGRMTSLPMDVLMEKAAQLLSILRERGYRYTDPFYTMDFISSVHLPDLRLNADGLVSVKERKVLIPSRKIEVGLHGKRC